MAVRLEGTIKRFIGSSTDEKPTSEVPAGSSFLETNTGMVFRFDGRIWIPSLHEETYGAYFQAIISELGEIKDLLVHL